MLFPKGWIQLHCLACPVLTRTLMALGTVMSVCQRGWSPDSSIREDEDDIYEISWHLEDGSPWHFVKDQLEWAPFLPVPPAGQSLSHTLRNVLTLTWWIHRRCSLLLKYFDNCERITVTFHKGIHMKLWSPDPGLESHQTRPGCLPLGVGGCQRGLDTNG